MPFKPISPTSLWKTLDRPHPHVTTSGIAFDADGNFPLLYRSDQVRSAKNCWSFPSGLHEVGLTLHEQFYNELEEELNLILLDSITHGVYENIAAVDDWHWVIAFLSGRVETLGSLTNKEPDKHSEVKIESVHTFDPANYNWAPGLGQYLEANWPSIQHSILLSLSNARLGLL